MPLQSSTLYIHSDPVCSDDKKLSELASLGEPDSYWSHTPRLRPIPEQQETFDDVADFDMPHELGDGASARRSDDAMWNRRHHFQVPAAPAAMYTDNASRVQATHQQQQTQPFAHRYQQQQTHPFAHRYQQQRMQRSRYKHSIPPVAYAQPPLSQQTQQGFDQQDLRVQGQSFGQRVAGRTPPRLALNQWRDVTFADLQRKQPQPSLAILPPLQPSLPRLQQQVIQQPPLTPTPQPPHLQGGDVRAVNVVRLPIAPPINVPRTPRQATRTSRYYPRQQKQKY